MKKKYKITASNADKYKLYEEAVQNVDFEVNFYSSIFKKYSKIHTKAAIVMPVIYFVMNLAMMAISYPMSHKAEIITAIALFVIGWMLNFIGHAIEGKKPAFLHNLSQTLIAPIFIIEEIAELFGFKVFNIQYNSKCSDTKIDHADKNKSQSTKTSQQSD